MFLGLSTNSRSIKGTYSKYHYHFSKSINRFKLAFEHAIYIFLQTGLCWKSLGITNKQQSIENHGEHSDEFPSIVSSLHVNIRLPSTHKWYTFSSIILWVFPNEFFKNIFLCLYYFPLNNAWLLIIFISAIYLEII
jgi:hypothetical protein